jgi:hypothetical protein
MAETFGVAASAASIIKVAAQVAASIDKLQRFWNQVKQAPLDVKHLMSELDLINVTLNYLQNDQALGLGLDHSYVQNCLKRCEEGSKELQLVVQDLERLLQSENKWKKKVGAVRMVLKSDDIKNLKARLECAINLLKLALMAYQCHKKSVELFVKFFDREANWFAVQASIQASKYCLKPYLQGFWNHLLRLQ